MVRARRILIESSLPPERAVLLLRDEPHAFALVGEWGGAPGALLGSRPVRVAAPDDDPFELLAEQPAVDADGDAAVGGGWFGWLGYELGATIERLPPAPPRRHERPPFFLAYYDHVIRHDGERWWFECLGETAAQAEHLERWRALLASAEPQARDFKLRAPFTPRAPGTGAHAIGVVDCVDRIAAGELFQANIGLRLETSFDGDLVDAAALAFERARPRFGALVDGVLSVSPERFLRRTARDVWTEPIKGTAKRSPDDAQADAAAGAALAESAKDRAEHVMIVDLMRNDLGRVSEFGSVRADPPRIEGHRGVWHMVSTVAGRLRANTTDADLLRATFPPGSVTGAPKVQSMKVIAALEAHARHAFSGAIGFASPIAGLDLSVAIRTFETADDAIWLDVGGGIVADSTPEAELREVRAKASGPIAAIGGELDLPDAGPSALPPLPRAIVFGDRPDPARGVFTTVLIENGEPVDLEAHLERLGVQLQATARSPFLQRARMRISVTRDGEEVTVTPEPATQGSVPVVALRPVLLPGGLGPRKWIDRDLLAKLADAFPGEVPLLVDADGSVLEAAYANIWLHKGDAWLTPPADGRILPGVTRARLLRELPGAREQRLTLADLPGGTVHLSSSIRGLHEAASLGSHGPSHGRPTGLLQETRNVFETPETQDPHRDRYPDRPPSDSAPARGPRRAPT